MTCALSAILQKPMTTFSSWGRYPPHVQSSAIEPDLVGRAIVWPTTGSILPVGLGRSYGDLCLNSGNSITPMAGFRHFLAFDQHTGIVRCEAGVSLRDILDVFVPRGWFLPVTPGTKYVTVGGAIANDVHGKNHHRAGTFGRFVHRFLLARSDGTFLECSQKENPELFRATIGGLGLTGAILWADIELAPIAGPWMLVDSIPFSHYEEFFSLSRESEEKFDYVVAWVDCLARGSRLGRGVLFRGNHFPEPGPIDRRSLDVKVSVPFTAPSWLLAPWSIRIFNAVYGAVEGRRREAQKKHFNPFFYPLDAVGGWNRLYGPRGFLQFQCVASREAVGEVLRCLSQSAAGSFLAVLKEFGPMTSPGLLSFPQSGVTLALDLPITGPAVFSLMQRLEDIVIADGGRLYPAKDAVMRPSSFERCYPQWRELEKLRDPRISSSFWRRVTEGLE
jgi:FAD/FMN-containing dehydrogenase